MVLTNATINDITASIGSYVEDNFTYFATGTGTAEKTTSDSALESEVYQAVIEDFVNLTTSQIVSGYVRANEANGDILSEIGFKTGSGGELKQTALLGTTIDKDSTKEIWFDLEINNSVTQG